MGKVCILKGLEPLVIPTTYPPCIVLKGNNIILIIVVSKGNLGATSTTGTFSVLKIGNSRGIGLMVYMASHYPH